MTKFWSFHFIWFLFLARINSPTHPHQITFIRISRFRSSFVSVLWLISIDFSSIDDKWNEKTQNKNGIWEQKRLRNGMIEREEARTLAKKKWNWKIDGKEVNDRETHTYEGKKWINLLVSLTPPPPLSLSLSLSLYVLIFLLCVCVCVLMLIRLQNFSMEFSKIEPTER